MLHRETTSDQLFNVLIKLMRLPELADFRLVGGTALSLIKGHRESVDIDLFSSGPYGEIAFEHIHEVIKATFPYVDDANYFVGNGQNNLGLNLFIGDTEATAIKTDILYWDAPFLFPPLEEEGIRLATLKDIAAMKLDVISRGGRKKDFWDLAEILEDANINDLMDIYQIKYPWLDINDVILGLAKFETAEEMPDPICFRQRNWDDIKSKMLALSNYLKNR